MTQIGQVILIGGDKRRKIGCPVGRVTWVFPRSDENVGGGNGEDGFWGTGMTSATCLSSGDMFLVHLFGQEHVKNSQHFHSGSDTAMLGIRYLLDQEGLWTYWPGFTDNSSLTVFCCCCIMSSVECSLWFCQKKKPKDGRMLKLDHLQYSERLVYTNQKCERLMGNYKGMML